MITIIVLLILAGISISMLSGRNGVLTRASGAKVENRAGAVEDQINLWKGEIRSDNLVDEYVGETSGQPAARKLKDVLDGLERDGNLKSEERKQLEEDGFVTIGSKTISIPLDAKFIANSKNKKNYLGAELKGYDGTPVENWKIYYADGDENNIYIISSNCISSKICPEVKGYKVDERWSEYGMGLVSVSSAYKAIDKINNIKVRNLNKDYFDYLEKNNQGPAYSSTYGAMMYLLDTNAWSGFNNGRAEFAIGTSTVELLFKAYNQKYGTAYEAQAQDSSGYYVRKSISDTWHHSMTFDYKDTLYGTGIWIASPHKGSFTLFRAQSDDNLGYGWDLSDTQGLRPIVCLKSNNYVIRNSDGTFSLF